MVNFWKKLKKPILILAPMANVTDAAFRGIIAKYGKPDVFWTEFVSANGLVSEGKNKLLADLKFSKKERPIVAQLFTGDPENLAKAAKLVTKLGFDGLDFNIGCPDRSIEKSGAGAVLIKNSKLAKELIRVMKANTRLPVSVKTRIGYAAIDLDWIKDLLEENLDALAIHLRTRKEMSGVPAHWELIPKIIELRDKISPGTLIIGNGDVATPKEAIEKCKKYKCDGVMIGRGIFGNPWLFSKKKKEVALAEKLKALIEHIRLFDKYFRGVKNFAVMKKHFKAYVSGFDNAKDLRIKLMGVNTAKEAGKIIRDFLVEV
ncbi:MAG TPA: tRNA-dihydrouridine synthase [Candidatus Paceibacterota bacterium]|nr:tRNA-dihydrouridine synthase [Candidatus Paceibacterota bacterium]